MRKVVGIHACRETLRVRPKDVSEIWFLKNWESSADLKGLHETAIRAGLKPQTKSKEVMEQLAQSHQGIALTVRTSPEFDGFIEGEIKPSLLLYLDHIEDPQNLGAILRTSWLMGVEAIWTPKSRSAALGPSAHKVASGGAEHVPVTEISGVDSFLEDCKANNYWIFGLSHKAKSSIYNVKLPERVLFCIGSEEKGLRSNIEKACDELIQIPQADPAASLNAGVSAAIAMSQFRSRYSL